MYFEGQIIDGVQHSFTSDLTANCEILDVYFWNRFDAFKDIESIKDLKSKDQRHIFMRWYEKGFVKQRKQEKKAKKEQKVQLNPEEVGSQSSSGNTNEDNNQNDGGKS